jgi:hypothetical protein
LANDITQCTNTEAEEFCSEYVLNSSNADFDQLNQRFTVAEILECVKCLKREKAMGSDYIMN